MRDVFVISDLHLGGGYAATPEAGRGFRLLTQKDPLRQFLSEIADLATPVELVINGDFVDFLAERHTQEPHWRPFVTAERDAVGIFRTIVSRDPEVFAALKKLIACGHRLTFLLGNHDLELTLPAVRKELEETLGIGPHDYTFLLDGEAYQVGDALIEHGNRYDPVNEVDTSKLLELRLLHSRGYEAPEDAFLPPLGSRLVSSVFNPIKEIWPFIDLLKPESEALVAVLLALDPDLRGHIGSMVGAWARGPLHDFRGSLPESLGADISSTAATTTRGGGGEAQEDPLADWLDRALGEDADGFLEAVDGLAESRSAPRAKAETRSLAVDYGSRAAFRGGDVSATSIWARFSLFRQVLNGRFASWDTRVHLVRQALRALQGDQSFRRDVETGKSYLEAAESLTRGPWPGAHKYSAVIFGHTHLPKSVRLESQALYLNSGSWADQMRFPAALMDDSDEVAREALVCFLDDLKAGRLAPYIHFEPTYIKIEVDDAGRSRSELRRYVPGSIAAGGLSARGAVKP
ncbi:MAG: metallophosphoesterase [Acidobacteriota bacterium]